MTKLIHAESGQFQASLAVIPLSKHDPQAMGSAITYGRRYSLSAMLGIVTEEDDDGNAATYAVGNRYFQQQNGKTYPSRQEAQVGKKPNESSRTPLTTYMEKLGLQDLSQCYLKYLSAKYKCPFDRLTNEQYQEQRATLEKFQSDALTMRNFMRMLHSYM